MTGRRRFDIRGRWKEASSKRPTIARATIILTAPVATLQSPLLLAAYGTINSYICLNIHSTCTTVCSVKEESVSLHNGIPGTASNIGRRPCRATRTLPCVSTHCARSPAESSADRRNALIPLARRLQHDHPQKGWSQVYLMQTSRPPEASSTSVVVAAANFARASRESPIHIMFHSR